MIKRRLSSAFLIALLVSGGCTFLLSRKLKLRSTVVDTQSYVAAAAPLDAGAVLDAGKLKMVQWPVSVPLAGAFLKPQDFVGRSLLYPLAAGAPILDRDLAIPGTGLTAKIPEGMRALALRSDEVVGVAGFLFPGSHVDVLVTYRSEGSSRPGYRDGIAKRGSAGRRKPGAAESGWQTFQRERGHGAGDTQRCRTGGAGEYPGNHSFCAAK